MKKFRMYMLEHDVSNNDLAKLLNTSKSNISKRLSGKVLFTISELEIIRKHFGLSDRELVEMFLESVPE